MSAVKIRVKASMMAAVRVAPTAKVRQEALDERSARLRRGGSDEGVAVGEVAVQRLARDPDGTGDHGHVDVGPDAVDARRGGVDDPVDRLVVGGRGITCPAVGPHRVLSPRRRV